MKKKTEAKKEDPKVEPETFRAMTANLYGAQEIKRFDAALAATKLPGGNAITRSAYLVAATMDKVDRVPINIVFDGPPSHESGRFVEVENDQGEGVGVGEWIDRKDGMWALRICELPRKDYGPPKAGG